MSVSWAPDSYDSGTAVCECDGSLRLMWIVLWEPWAHGLYTSQFMVVADLYAGTWVLGCAFPMWAPRTVKCIVIIMRSTRFFVARYGMACSYAALHFVREYSG